MSAAAEASPASEGSTLFVGLGAESRGRFNGADAGDGRSTTTFRLRGLGVRRLTRHRLPLDAGAGVSYVMGMPKPFPAHATFLRQKIACGKRRCGTCAGVRYAHGPYWYAYWWAEGRTRSAYIGKRHPGGAAGERESAKAERRIVGDPWTVLGVRRNADAATVRRAYRRRAFETHPDRGGSHAEAVAVNRAWAEIRKAKGWR